MNAGMHPIIKKKYNQALNHMPKDQVVDFFNRLPATYFLTIDFDDLLIHALHIPTFLSETKQAFTYQSDIEQFTIIKPEMNLLKSIWKRMYHENDEDPKLFRLYRDRLNKFFMIASFPRLVASGRIHEPNLTPPEWQDLYMVDQYTSGQSDDTFLITHSLSDDVSVIHMELAQVPAITLFRNMLESLWITDWSYIEVWLTQECERSLQTIFSVENGFYTTLSQDAFDSIKRDYERYIQKYLEKRSIFDIVGPAMVGPSSSHTAGANRIGQMARNYFVSLLEEKVCTAIHHISIKLLGSFRDTGIGHNTPEAMIAGLSGLDTADPSMISTGKNALSKRQAFSFTLKDQYVPFTGFIKGTVEDDTRYQHEHNSNIAEIIAQTDTGIYSITGFSVGGGNIEIRYLNGTKLKEAFTGKQNVAVSKHTWNIAPYNQAAASTESMEANKEWLLIHALEVKDTEEDKLEAAYSALDQKISSAAELYLDFNTFEELLDEWGEDCKGESLLTSILQYEKEVSGLQASRIMVRMKRLWNIMEQAIETGLASDEWTPFRLSGKDSSKLHAFFSSHKEKDTIFTKAMRYAIAVNEMNAKNGLIVACPTGGACGMLPGVLKAWQQTHKWDDPGAQNQQIVEALLVAGFLGMILFDDVRTAGADLGCQAEVGGGAAMAAAAFVYVEQGTLDQMIQAFALALKNSMGLICDPVAGLVEVPCIKRNGVYATMAISAAYMALAGVSSAISPDEVVLALKEVGERMPEDYRETARAGLAKTRDGKVIDYQFSRLTQQFFK